MYYLTINGTVDEFDNELAYFLKINKLKELGYNIEYETAEGEISYSQCYATQ
jgi:hypothetical protein